MKLIRAISALSIAAAFLLCSCQSGKPSFVRVEDGKFVCEDYPSHFVGTNFWYGAILGSEGVGGDRERLEAELDTLKALGMVNLRVLVGGDGPDGVPTRVSPTLQKEPGVYNDTIFRGLDVLLAEMAERDMRAVLYLNNSWEWSGGYGMYLEWAGAGKAVIPAEVGYVAYCESVSRFMTNEKAKGFFADYVRHVVSRTNTVTGRPYKDDPTIFSWQIGNEPRCFSSDPAVHDAFVEWMWGTAALIKSIDPNHMVSSGSEGRHGCEGSLELFERIHSCPDIDYMNIHIWPYNWSWVRENTLSTNFDKAKENTDEYIDEHLAVAERHGKPVVIEEFGFPRDDFRFAQGTPVTSRDEYYGHVLNRLVDSAKDRGLLAGINFWGWGGLAGQSPVNIYWQPGDDYCGDPAQEQQGLNSVYVSDVSTTDIIRKAAGDLAETSRLTAEFCIDDNTGIFVGEGPYVLDVSMFSDLNAKQTVVLDVFTDFGQQVASYEKTVKFRQDRAVASFRLDLLPGFYKAVLSIVEEDGTKKEISSTNLGFNPELIVSEQDKQPDFDAFWQETLEDLSAVDPQYRLTLLEDRSSDVCKLYRVDMKSLGGEPVSGILTMPAADGKYPVRISYMGYGSNVWYTDPSYAPEMIDFQVCIRNQALNRKPGEKDDWCVRGLESKDTYYYRGAFADAVRAVDFVCSLDKADTSRVFAHGESQGGALILVAASLDHRIKAIAPSAPFLNDYKDYFAIAHWPAEPMLKAAQELGISEDDLYETLSYFDVKNFTDRIECPVIMAIGLQDPVCPPHTNFAGYNHIRTEKSWICYPHTGHDVWRQKGWEVKKDEFFKRYL